PAPAAPQVAGVSAPAAADVSQRILLTSIADHLDRSERVLTDIMNAPDRGDISTEQQWAEDLLTTSRLYRQDAVQAGERTVASVLDDLERSLLEIVHSPSEVRAADLEQIRRRIDAAALLFKVRVLSEELRQREEAPAPSLRTQHARSSSPTAAGVATPGRATRTAGRRRDSAPSSPPRTARTRTCSGSRCARSCTTTPTARSRSSRRCSPA